MAVEPISGVDRVRRSVFPVPRRHNRVHRTPHAGVRAIVPPIAGLIHIRPARLSVLNVVFAPVRERDGCTSSRAQLIHSALVLPGAIPSHWISSGAWLRTPHAPWDNLPYLTTVPRREVNAMRAYAASCHLET